MGHKISNINFTPIHIKSDMPDTSAAIVSLVIDDDLYVAGIELTKMSGQYEIIYPFIDYGHRKVYIVKPKCSSLDDLIRSEIEKAYELELSLQAWLF